MEELKKSLKINASCLIKSSLNKKVYLDEDRKGYLFFDEKNAKQFVSEHDDTYYERKDFRDDDELLSDCYAQGAISVMMTGGRKVEEIPIKPTSLKRKFYNSNLNAAITLCRHSKRHNGEYLTYIAACKMIVPVKISPDANTQIIYGTVHLEGGHRGRIYIAFSDLDEYEKFATQIKGWEPLIVTFDVMCQISKEHGYMINPLGDKLIMTQKLMQKYRDKWQLMQKKQ